jgi:SAM-dependent methyltransferase
LDKKILDKQAQHWENTFINRPETFGVSPSAAAIRAAEIFNKKDITNILELGAGQGRDTLFFAQKGFHIQVLDYSQTGLDNIIKKAKTLGVDKLITGKIHDVRNPLPFTDKKFGGCFSHMLYCMALTTKELKFLSDEIHRVLKNGGVNIYTVRHTGDGDYKNGIHRGEDLYESSGFIVHFFSKEKVKQLSNGFDIVNIENFEEGKFPRKLFRVTLKKV